METLMGNEATGKILTKDSACPSFTVKQRIYGFLTCFIIGCVLSFLSIGGIFGGLLNPKKFGMLYSLGNLCSLGSTLFLIGPMRQLKRMFKNTRYLATLLFLGSLIGTIVFCFFYEKKIWQKLVLLSLIVLQFCALFWYTLSYIPFGRTLCKKICCAICCNEEEETSGTSGGSEGETKA